MSKFNKIEELKENFDDNLYQSNEFKHTKGLFRNFKKYYEKNKTLITGLIGAIAINTMIFSSPISKADTEQAAPVNSHISYDLDSVHVPVNLDDIPEIRTVAHDLDAIHVPVNLDDIPEIRTMAHDLDAMHIPVNLDDMTQFPTLESINKSYNLDEIPLKNSKTYDLDKYESDLTTMMYNYKDRLIEKDPIKRTINFMQDVDLSHQIKNIKHANDNVQEIDEAGIASIMSLKADEMIVFKNPFWENNTMEVYGARPEHNSHYQPEILNNAHQSTISNSLYLLDTSANEIRMAKDFITGKETEQELIDLYRFVIYHEATHASLKQSINYDPVSTQLNRDVDREAHSDVAALTMIGVETGSLSHFNKMVDKIIKMRVNELAYGYDSHNTVYVLVELKKAINDNPKLLEMNKRDVIEFSSMITNHISNTAIIPNGKTYAIDLRANKDDIKKNILEGGYSRLLSSIVSDIEKKPFSSMQDYTDENKKLDPMVEKISNSIASGFRYNQIVSAAYEQTYEQFKQDKTKRENRRSRTMNDFVEKLISNIEQEVQNRPIITKEVLAGVSNKVFIDEVNYDYSKVLKIKESLKDKETNEHRFLKNDQI